MGNFQAALSFCAPVAQLDRAPDYGSGGLGFESLQARHQVSLTSEHHEYALKRPQYAGFCASIFAKGLLKRGEKGLFLTKLSERKIRYPLWGLILNEIKAVADQAAHIADVHTLTFGEFW